MLQLVVFWLVLFPKNSFIGYNILLSVLKIPECISYVSKRKRRLHNSSFRPPFQKRSIFKNDSRLKLINSYIRVCFKQLIYFLVEFSSQSEDLNSCVWVCFRCRFYGAHFFCGKFFSIVVAFQKEHRIINPF